MFHERTGFDLTAALPDRRRFARSAFRTQRRPEETVTLLGEPVDLVRPEEVMHHIERWVRAGRKSVVANHNLHSLYLIRRDPGLRRFFQRADLTQLDSTPLVWFARLLGLSSRPFHRCTYLDWRDHFWSLANREAWRVMYVGGAPGVAERAAQSLNGRAPGATIAFHHGYFDATPGSADNTRVVAAVNEFQPNILFVGMGMRPVSRRPRHAGWGGSVWNGCSGWSSIRSGCSPATASSRGACWARRSPTCARPDVALPATRQRAGSRRPVSRPGSGRR